jgi:hypothetical protein
MENNRKFTEILVSSQPNIDCDLCSYLEPDERVKDPQFDFPYSNCSGWIGYRSPTHCPSCRRSATRYFVTEEYVSWFQRVPEDIRKFSHLEFRSNSNPLWVPQPPPTHPRPSFDIEEYDARNADALISRKEGMANQSKQRLAPLPKPTVEVLPEAKPTGFRLKIGKLP